MFRAQVVLLILAVIGTIGSFYREVKRTQGPLVLAKQEPHSAVIGILATIGTWVVYYIAGTFNQVFAAIWP